MLNSNKLIALGILPLSILTIMAGAAVSPALADIQKNLAGASPTLVKMILTIPALFIIPTSMAIGRIGRKTSKKRLALFGVFIYTVAGCWAFVANDIYMLLASRAVLGVAVGIIMPVAASLIADFFDGERRLKMMGYYSSLANFGGIVSTFSSGLLTTIDWRYAFLVYATGIPVFILGLLFIKDPERNITGNIQKSKLPIATYYAAFPMFLIFLGFYCIPTNIAVYLIESGLGGPAQAGYALAFSTGTAMVLALKTAEIKRITGRLFIPSIAFAMLLCHALLGFTHSIISINIAMVANGYTLSMALPYVMHKATETSKGNNVAATSLVTTAIFIGQFFSPIILDGVAKITGSLNPAHSFQIVAVGSSAALLYIGMKRLFR